MNPIETAHRDLKNILFNGRILLNGIPLTTNEMGIIIQGEQLLFEKAMKQDAAQKLAAKQKEEPKKKG